MSLSALLHISNSSHVWQWKTLTVSQILVEGDAMDVEAFNYPTKADHSSIDATKLSQSPVEAKKLNKLFCFLF